MQINRVSWPWCLMLVLVLAVHPGAAYAGAAAERLQGTWALTIEGKPIFVIELARKPGGMHGRFEAPRGLALNNTIFEITDAKRSGYRLVSSTEQGDTLALTFEEDGGKQRSFELRPTDGGARLAIPGVPIEAGIGPWLLERVAPGTRVSEDWQQNRAYTVADVDQDNQEMGEIYASDQAARSQTTAMAADLVPTDRARRQRTLALLRSGALNTGRDLKNAAFVLQHGEVPDDYLLAHSLAVAAITKGEASAAWIASASLDRYLRSIGKRQIYGTQLGRDEAGQTVRPDFDDSLVPESLRVQLGVPAVLP